MTSPQPTGPFTPEEADAVLRFLSFVDTHLKPHLVTLSDEERAALEPVGPRRKAWIRQQLEIARARRDDWPEDLGFTFEEWERSVQTSDLLEQVRQVLSQLMGHIDDWVIACQADPEAASESASQAVKRAKG